MADPAALPPLPEVDIKTVSELSDPMYKITSDNDVRRWKTTQGYKTYILFLRRLSESVVGFSLPEADGEYKTSSPAIASMLSMLDTLDRWIDDIPPLPTPQRFGNLAYRTWGKRLEDNATELINTLLPTELRCCERFMKPYLVISFGSFTRLDYGTGHETAFGIMLLCLTLIRFFKPVPEEERSLVLVVFRRYLKLCWRLQDVYRLEPAGSHGVWGLDDYCFLGYIFGGGQLRDQSDIPVSAVLRKHLPSTNLYFLLINRIYQVKQGPFHEHSSQLYSIATGVPNWGKVYSGLIKMYEAEVLGKRVVVQHLPVGGLLEWDVSEGTQSQPETSFIGRPEAGVAHTLWAGLPAAPYAKAHSPLSKQSGMSSSQPRSPGLPP